MIRSIRSIVIRTNEYIGILLSFQSIDSISTDFNWKSFSIVKWFLSNHSHSIELFIWTSFGQSMFMHDLLSLSTQSTFSPAEMLFESIIRTNSIWRREMFVCKSNIWLSTNGRRRTNAYSVWFMSTRDCFQTKFEQQLSFIFLVDSICLFDTLYRK